MEVDTEGNKLLRKSHLNQTKEVGPEHMEQYPKLSYQQNLGIKKGSEPTHSLS